MIGAGGKSTSPTLPVASIAITHTLPDETPNTFYIALDWDFKKYPHALLVGGTGSGKTHLLKRLIAAFAYFCKDSELYLTTYKVRTEDFGFLQLTNHFGDHVCCADIFNDFYDRFELRLNGTDEKRTPLVLFFDEWVGFLLSLEKKEQDDFTSRMGRMLMLGRSLGVQIVVSMQRPDAAFFKNGARDNFNLVIAMGNLSDDGKKMLFSNNVIQELHPCTQIGSGHALIGGHSVHYIRVPPLTQKHLRTINNKFNRLQN